MFVNKSTATLINVPNSDLKVVNSARVSFAKEVFEMSSGDEGLIRYLATHNHWTPFSHCRETFTFDELRIEDFGALILNLSQEDTAGLVWALNGRFISMRHSIFGWAQILKKITARGMNDFFDRNDFGQIVQTLTEKYPVSAKYLLSDEVMAEYTGKYIVCSHPQGLARNPYFIDITVREKTPIFVARQRFKHMVGVAYNEVSRRYVDTPPDVYFPDVWRSKAPNKKQGSLDEPAEFMYRLPEEDGGLTQNIYAYNSMEEIVEFYNLLIENLVCPEQARMMLPQAMMTEYYVTANLAAWNRSIHQRTDSHAQVEIQDLFKLSEKCIIEYLNDIDFDLD